MEALALVGGASVFNCRFYRKQQDWTWFNLVIVPKTHGQLELIPSTVVDGHEATPPRPPLIAVITKRPRRSPQPSVPTHSSPCFSFSLIARGVAAMAAPVAAYSPALRVQVKAAMDATSSFRVLASLSFPGQRASFPSIRMQKRSQVSCSLVRTTTSDPISSNSNSNSKAKQSVFSLICVVHACMTTVDFRFLDRQNKKQLRRSARS